MRAGILMVMTLFNTACSVFGVRSEETPKYEVLQKGADKEIRQYSSYIVAKVEVQGDYEKSQREGFRILAGYIFGGNQSKTKISMTAPVEQAKSEKIAMTAPVELGPTATGWTMAFSMPSKYKIEDLPIPNDNRVKLEEVPSKIVGVITYTGSRSEELNREKASDLESWLRKEAGYEITGLARYAGYDPPWTLPPFRRNEMMFDLVKK